MSSVVGDPKYNWIKHWRDRIKECDTALRLLATDAKATVTIADTSFTRASIDSLLKLKAEYMASLADYKRLKAGKPVYRTEIA